MDQQFKFTGTATTNTGEVNATANSPSTIPSLPSALHPNQKKTQQQNAPPPVPPPHRPSAGSNFTFNQNSSNARSTPLSTPAAVPQVPNHRPNIPSIPPQMPAVAQTSPVVKNSHDIPHIPSARMPSQRSQPNPTPIPVPNAVSHGASNTRAPRLEKLAPGTLLTVGKHQVTIVKYLSEGGFAHIYVVKTNPPEQGTDIACLKRVIVPNKEGLNQLRAEVEVMQRLAKADNIVRYYDSNASRLPNASGCYEVLVLMELCPNKSLLDFMNSRLRTKLTTNEILKIMLDISKAVYSMHRMKLIHRDIKIENVLLDENYNFKLADFGSTCPILRVPRNHQEFQILHNDILMQTTPQYRCPEMIDLYRGLPIDEKSDIWALGVFLYKLCYYTTPFEVPGELGILHSAYTFPAQPVFPSGIKNLINIMLQENPIFRPNIYQVLVEVCKLSGFDGETTGKIMEEYTDIYGLSKYQYPISEHIHPAIEPFTPSIVPMFSPFKAPPRDPMEVHMQMQKMMQQQAEAQQQQQQQQQKIQQQQVQNQQVQQQEQPIPVIKNNPSSESFSMPTVSANSIQKSVSTDSISNSNILPDNTNDISTIEEADPFSTLNLKRSSGTSGSIKTIPKVVLSGVTRQSPVIEGAPGSHSQVDINDGINQTYSSSVGGTMEELNILDSYRENSGHLKSNLNLKMNSKSSIVESDNESTYSYDKSGTNNDTDLNLNLSVDNVASRFPAVNFVSETGPQTASQSNLKLNTDKLPMLNNPKSSDNLLHVNYLDKKNDADLIRRSKSLKISGENSSRLKNRYSVNNPFPTSDEIDMQLTGNSVLSYEDIKDDLIDIEQPKYSESKSRTPSPHAFLDPKSKTKSISSTKSSDGNSRNSSRLQGHRRLSSDQLEEEVINFSDENL